MILNEWNESTRAAIAQTLRSFQSAVISDDLSSAFNNTDSLGRPNASAAAFADLAAAAAAAAVICFCLSNAANAANCVELIVLVFTLF